MFELEEERIDMLEAIQEHIERKQFGQLRALLNPLESQDIAILMEDLPMESIPSSSVC